MTTQNVMVAEVIDGDTFKTTGGESVRLLDVDAPELHEPKGIDAKHGLARLLPTGAVVVISYETRDIYGRPLANVWNGQIPVNDEMRKYLAQIL